MPTISSRTPEGLANRCSICGAEFLLEPSFPRGDATCPRCGQLVLWFAGKLKEHFGISGEDFNLDAPLIDLHRESLETVELVMEIEELFEHDRPEDEELWSLTIREFLRRLRWRDRDEPNT